MKAFDAYAVSLRTNPVLVLVAITPLCGALAGAAMAADARLGVAVVLGLLFLPLVVINLQLALVLWLPLVFLEGLPAYNAGAKLGGLLIAAAWLVAATSSRSPLTNVLSRHRPLLIALAALLLWSTLSLLWAEDTQLVLEDLWRWYAVAVLLLVVATTAATQRGVRMLCVAFVAGATLSVAHGLLSGGGLGLSSGELAASSFNTVAESEGRLVGAGGDPNFLAAGVVAAIILGIVLSATARRQTARWALGGAVALLILGLAASQSRGGLVTALVVTMAAFAVFKRQRVWALALVTVAVGIVGAWFAVSPTAWERISNTDAGGSGRSELWTLGWRVFEDRPVTGAGLFNYHVAARDYTREAGSLSRVDLLFTHKRQEAHNLYLQTAADTGAVGLALLLAVAFACMHAAWLAAKRSQALGDRSMEMLARGVLLATIGFLASSFFLSDGIDKRLWVLFGLGPAMLAVASKRPGKALEPGPS